MNNPIKFKEKELIRDIYENKIYKVIEPDKKGMARLLNLTTNRIENWNSCNNPRFEKQLIQLSLF